MGTVITIADSLALHIIEGFQATDTKKLTTRSSNVTFDKESPPTGFQKHPAAPPSGRASKGVWPYHAPAAGGGSHRRDIVTRDGKGGDENSRCGVL